MIFTIYKYKEVNTYYTSGMSFSNWVDEFVCIDNASILLGEVSAVVYNQASYNRAALAIWRQIYFGSDYSSDWLSTSGGNGGGVSKGGGGASTLAPGAGLAVSGVGAGAEWGKTAKPAKYGSRFASASKLTKVGAKAANALSRGATAVGSLITIGFAGYEIKNGQANTHTFVDVGVAFVAMAGLFASAPVALGIAIGASIYGIASAGGLGLAIDKATDNWGNKIIYKRDEEDY